MNNKEPGYVYILTNPSFREDWVKIGKSSRPVDVRSKELDNTAVPLPFEIFATMKTVKFNEAEKLVHRYIERFTNLRIRNNREFFNVKPEKPPKFSSYSNINYDHHNKSRPCNSIHSSQLHHSDATALSVASSINISVFLFIFLIRCAVSPEVFSGIPGSSASM